MSDTGRILQEYDRRQSQLASLEARTKELILQLLRSAGIPVQSVQSRVKNRSSLQAKCERPDKNYQEFSQITDVVGFRIITYFEDDIDRVSRQIASEFNVDPQKSVDKRKTDSQRFGYASLHQICRHKAEREVLVEYSEFAGMVWEVQVCSILQHAWNEIEHDLGYKAVSKLPDHILRRFTRLSSVLELADEEFKQLRKTVADYRKSLSLMMEVPNADLSGLPLDSVSLRSFIEQSETVTEVDRLLAGNFNLIASDSLEPKPQEWVLSGLKMLGIDSLQRLQQELQTRQYQIEEFLRFSIKECPARGIAVNTEQARRGVSVFQLTIMLVAQKGESYLAAFCRETNAFGSLQNQLMEVQLAAVSKIPF